MQNFPIRLDLSNFFSDARSYSLILVDGNLSNIKDLQDHIQKLFQLNDISLVTVEGCYLPPKESIELLQTVEIIKAFCLNPPAEPQVEVSEDNPAVVNPSQESVCSSKKRKNRSAETEKEFSSSTPNYPKRSKSRNGTLRRTELSTLNANESHKETTRKSARNKSKRQADGVEDVAAGSESSTSQDSTPATLKHQSANHGNGNTSSIPSGTTNSIFNKHTISNEEEDRVETEDLETEKSAQITTPKPSVAPPPVQFTCPVMKLKNISVRIFKLQRKKKEPVVILEDIVIAPPAVVPSIPANNDETIEKSLKIEESKPAEADAKPEEAPPAPAAESTQAGTEIVDLEEQSNAEETVAKIPEQSLLDSDSEDDVMVLDDTNMDESTLAKSNEVTRRLDETIEIISDMLRTAAPLTTLPSVGETIIFKLPKTKGGTKLSPKTDFIAGTCSYINRRSKCITIAIIACPKEAKKVLEQYASHLDDSVDALQAVNINFKDMFEANVIVSTLDD